MEDKLSKYITIVFLVLFVVSSLCYFFFPVLPDDIELLLWLATGTAFIVVALSFIMAVVERLNQRKKIRIEAVMVTNLVFFIIVSIIGLLMSFNIYGFRDFCMVNLGMSGFVVGLFYSFSIISGLGVICLWIIKRGKHKTSIKVGDSEIDLFEYKRRPKPRIKEYKPPKYKYKKKKDVAFNENMMSKVARSMENSNFNRDIIVAMVLSLLILGGIGVYSYTKYIREGGYVLDLGAVNEGTKLIELAVSPRVSEKKAAYDSNEKIVTYRELLHPLVYVNVLVPKRWQSFDLTVRFQDKFPVNSLGFYVGAKTGKEWKYKWLRIYKPGLNLSKYDSIEEDGKYLYFISSDAPRFNSVKQFIENPPEDKVIAVDDEIIKNIPYESINYETGEFYLNNSLRGSQEFYVYANGDLVVNFTKEDMNAYAGEDKYNISLFYLNKTLISSKLIDDDGINTSSKEKINQTVKFVVNKLKPKVYLLKISFIGEGVDSTINNLKINQKKVVFNRKAYPLKPFKFYSEKNSFTFQTWHDSSKQIISINNDFINLSRRGVILNYSSEINDLEGYLPKGDVVINSNYVFSTTKEHYFRPFKYRLIDIDEFVKYKRKVDYVLIDYTWHKDGKWIIAKRNIKERGLYYKDKLSLVLSAKHLEDSKYKNFSIPVDYVKVKFYG